MTVAVAARSLDALCVKAASRGWRVRLYSLPGGPVLLSDYPTRLAWLAVFDSAGEEVEVVHLPEKRQDVNEAADLLLELLERGGGR